MIILKNESEKYRNGFIIKDCFISYCSSFIFVLGTYKKKMDMSMDLNLIKTFLALIPVIVWASTLFVAIVPANTVGVKYSRLMVQVIRH